MKSNDKAKIDFILFFFPHVTGIPRCDRIHVSPHRFSILRSVSLIPQHAGLHFPTGKLGLPSV